jgi:hypothetical protein
VQIGFLLAVVRLAQLYLTTLIGMSHLERSIYTVFVSLDGGYNSFLGMVMMIHVLELQAAFHKEQRPADKQQGDKNEASKSTTELHAQCASRTADNAPREQDASASDCLDDKQKETEWSPTFLPPCPNTADGWVASRI